MTAAEAAYDAAMKAHMEALRKLPKLGVGQPPYGYIAAKRNGVALHIEDPHEQSAIAKIVQLRNEGATYRGIAARLDELGYVTRQGGQWQSVTVRNIYDRAEAKRLKSEQEDHIARCDIALKALASQETVTVAAASVLHLIQAVRSNIALDGTGLASIAPLLDDLDL